MKKNQKTNNYPQITIPKAAFDLCEFTAADSLELHSGHSAIVLIKEKMTALELIEAAEMLREMASDLMVELAKACGLCDNCGEGNPQPCPDCQGDAVCAMLNGCKDSPTDCVSHCDLCGELLDESQRVQIPAYILEDADIPLGTKLEALYDEENDEIIVTESEIQQDISDVPENVIEILMMGGVCLASLDELIMTGEIVYGE
ncbi:hypothetical protein [Hungatella sp.]|uniref:hypothetical protein n=1 Tax=Hungatella sp. TaxID=2613924 RepID=UPI002A83DF69|nr:hypothetical protein [Hungatella sp.]